VTTELQPLGPAGGPRSAAGVVEGLGLLDPLRAPSGRPRVVAAMIASADGRAAVQGRSVGLGHPADRELLRELRTGVDALLVGSTTLGAERYAQLLDPAQRARRTGVGLPAQPLVATISRRLDVPVEIGLFAEEDARVHVYSEEAAGSVTSRGAQVAVHGFPAGALHVRSVLAHLGDQLGVRAVLCEGGPTLLGRLVAEGCLDDLLLTLAPMLVAGDEPAPLAGPALQPPAGLELASVYRAGDHLMLHYAVAR
jgi:riboflavin biosynthesis pyrimidine reductase